LCSDIDPLCAFELIQCISAGGCGGGFDGGREAGVADMVWCGGGGKGALLFMRNLSYDTEPLHEVFHDVSRMKNKETKERDKYRN